MKRLVLVSLFFFVMVPQVAAEETIYAKEVESYFYGDGKMKRSEGQFENTYHIKGDTITRTRVYDVKNKEVIPDDTVYAIQRQLLSDPTINMSLGVLHFERPVIRAIGQPGLDAVEILVIGETYVQSVKSTAHYFIITRMKRIE